MEGFKRLGLSERSIQALESKGFTEPTPIQAKVIPLLLEGKKDVIGQSQTGTGKTAGFALPIIERIKEHSKSVQAIVLTPTRELALQVAQEINSLKGDKDLRILPVYGGAPIVPQMQKLRQGIDIVVGTPGRVMDLQGRKSLNLDNIRYAVLDEADEMLNMGFVEDIENILQSTPKGKSMLLFSATMPKPILRIAEKYMREYEFIEVGKADVITKNVEQVYYDINANDRVEGLRRIIDFYPDFHGIVFCNTKSAVDMLVNQLSKMGYHSAALHGDITQIQREKILQQFRKKYVKILIATDVAARGIDVNDLTHVVNFSLPQSPESYVHRIGRTGRAGKKGMSVTFVIPSERRKLRFVEKINRCKLVKQKLPSPEDIVKNKQSQITAILKKIIDANSGKQSGFSSMAAELLKEHSPNEVVSAILRYSFKNELDITTYKDISEPESSKAKYLGNSGYRGKKPRQHQKSGSMDFRKKSKKRFNNAASDKSPVQKENGERKSGFRHNKRRKN